MTGNSTLRAAAWMSGSILSFSAMAVAGRNIAGVLDTFEIMLYRSAIGVLVIALIVTVTRRWSEVSTARLPMHVTRNLAHFTGQNLWFFAIGVAPLAQVFALEFTMPIWAMLLSIVVLGEALTRMRVAATFCGFLGILVITRPWSMQIGPGIPQAALAAVAFGVTAVLTRRLTRTDTPLSIMFWLTGLQTLYALVTAGYDLQIALPPVSALPWVIVIAFGGLVAHFCQTKALSLAPAAVVMPIDFVRLPLISVIALILFHEQLDWRVWAGAAIIFSANYANLLLESRATARARAQIAVP